MELGYFRTALLVMGCLLLLSTWIAKIRGRATIWQALRWSVVWGALCYVSVYPRITNKIAKDIGVGSGRFLVLYCSVIFLSCALVLVYARTRRLSREITLLVREVAIQREGEDRPKKSSSSEAV